MKPDQSPPNGMTPPLGGGSVGGESMPLAMQAEARRMSMDEATASGLFDDLDELGIVRIPINLNVMIPGDLLQPAGDHDPARSPHGVPPDAGRPPSRRRFGNYPKAIAARRLMESVRSQMSPAAVAPAAGLPAAIAVAAGRGAGMAAASVVAGSSGGLLDAGAQAELRGLALTAGRGAAAGPLGAAVAGALWPTRSQ